MVDRIAAKHGRKLYECPIGFKYIADLMMDHEIVIGGEESGGIGYSRYLPERDGILNALLLANVMAEETQATWRAGGRSAARVWPALLRASRFAHSRQRETGGDSKSAVRNRHEALGGYKSVRKENMDGMKLFLNAPDHGKGAAPWILFRASGTEPFLRLYSEAATPELVSEILEQAKSFVNQWLEHFSGVRRWLLPTGHWTFGRKRIGHDTL